MTVQGTEQPKNIVSLATNFGRYPTPVHLIAMLALDKFYWQPVRFRNWQWMFSGSGQILSRCRPTGS
jgi:hypothetical protein